MLEGAPHGISELRNAHCLSALNDIKTLSDDVIQSEKARSTRDGEYFTILVHPATVLNFQFTAVFANVARVALTQAITKQAPWPEQVVDLAQKVSQLQP